MEHNYTIVVPFTFDMVMVTIMRGCTAISESGIVHEHRR